eukprot:jgi/Phyca11/96579/e_gw1.1.388.1
MTSDKHPLPATAEDEGGQQQNVKRQKFEFSDASSEEESPVGAIKTVKQNGGISVNVKAKIPDVPLADKYRGGEFFFVRECYAEYYSKVEALLVEKEEECVTVTGTPGIGKSLFYAFFFDRFRKTHPDWTIIASTYNQNRNIKKLVVFEPTQSTRYDSPIEAEEALVTSRRYGHDKVLWLCDGPPKVEHGQTVVFTSSNEWLRVARNDRQTYYLPPWTLEELQLAASVLEYPFSDDEIENRFWNFGGVARNFFKLDPVNIKIAIHELTESIEAITESGKLENLLLGKRTSDTYGDFLLYNPKGDGRLYDTAILGLLDLVKANPKRAALVFVRPTDRSMDFQQQKILSGGTPPKEIRDLKGIGQGTVNILAKYFNVISTADLEAKVDEFYAGRIPTTGKKHEAAWTRAVGIWKREVQYLKDQSNITMVDEIPQYVYPLN